MKRRNIYSNASFDTEDLDYIDPGDYFSKASKERMAKAVKEHGPFIDIDKYLDDIDRAGGYDKYIAREKKNRSLYCSSSQDDENLESNANNLEGENRMIKVLSNENLVSGNLPRRIDNFLQDFAQSYGDITYTDIMNISDNDIPKIKSIVSKMKRELKDYYGDIYELSLEDSDFKKLCDELIKVIKLSKKGSYNTREGARRMYYDALDMNIENASRDYCEGVVDAIEALFDGGWLNESTFRTDL